MRWRLLLALIGGVAMALLAGACLEGVASLHERQVLPPATALLEASARAIEAELSLRGRTLAELSEEVAGDPDLPAEMEAVSRRADHRISQVRGVRPEVDAMTLMNENGIVVGTNAPRYHVGDSLVARPEGLASGGAPAPKHVAVGTPGLLDAVLAGYPSRGVSFLDGVLYHWGAAPIRVKHEVVGAVLIERRLQALPPAGCEAFLVVGGRVVLGRGQEGWRNFVAGGSDKPFLMIARDAGPDGKRPLFVDRDRIGVWAQRFHVPGSLAPVGFVTIDLAPAFAELASFQRMLVILAFLVWLAHTALLLTTSRLATTDGRWLQWLAERLVVLRPRPGELPGSPAAESSGQSPTVIVAPAQLPGGPAALDDEDANATPPLGVRIQPHLRGIIDELPSPDAAKPPTDAVAPDVANENVDMDATSTVAMTPELMAELGLTGLPEDPAFETQVMTLTPDLLAAMKAGPGPAATPVTPPETSPETKPATPSETEPETPSEAKPATSSETAPETPSEAKAVAPSEAKPATPSEAPSQVPEDPVYREVYTRFIGMRRLCGQPVDLAFEAFKEDLEKSQAEILARHGCKRVRFHVVIRSGKVILATTPLP